MGVTFPTLGPPASPAACRWAAIQSPLSYRALHPKLSPGRDSRHSVPGAGVHLQGFKSPCRPGDRVGLGVRACLEGTQCLLMTPIIPTAERHSLPPRAGLHPHLHRTGLGHGGDSPPGPGLLQISYLAASRWPLFPGTY